MSDVELSAVCKLYGKTPVVNDVSLHVANREFVVLVGPSGCGKSTTLRMVAGLEEISGGTIRIGDRVVNDLPPRDRDIAMVFQNYALYAHMSVYDNLAFGLRNRRVADEEIRRKIDAASKILGIEELMSRRPNQLSGGQQQRVALGRCIVRNPAVFSFRRAALKPGCEAQRTDALGAKAVARARTHYFDLRHTRPARGDDTR